MLRLFIVLMFALTGTSYAQDTESTGDYSLGDEGESYISEDEAPPADAGPESTEPPMEEPPVEEPAESTDDFSESTEAESTDLPDSFDNGGDDAPVLAAPPEDEPPPPEPEVSSSAVSDDDGDSMFEASSTQSSGFRSTETRLLGSYRVRIAAQRPNFLDLRGYDKLCGSTSWHPMFAADWFAFDWYATVGLSFRGGFYSDKCQTSSSKSDITPIEGTEDTFTIVPTQSLLIAEFTPFKAKWVVLEAWAGIEGTYFQQVRDTGDSDDSSSTSTSSTSTATDDDDKGSLANTGWKTGFAFGAGLNILLNPLDERSVKSMEGVMGLGYCYLTPYVEYVQTVGEGGLSLSRSAYGIGFTFESIR